MLDLLSDYIHFTTFNRTLNAVSMLQIKNLEFLKPFP